MVKINRTGLVTSVQDPAGRPGYQGIGLPSSGAMDTLALTVGNILVGNDPDEAGIEFTFIAPELTFTEDTLAAVTGVPAEVLLDGKPQPMWQALRVCTGQTLSIRVNDHVGQWGYISIAGGIDVPIFMDSKSTFAFSGIGGYKGRLLMPGDLLKTGRPADLSLAGKRLRKRYIPQLTDPMTVELMYGYYMDYLTEDDIEEMFSAEWVVLTSSNRMGYRLSGPVFQYSEKARSKGEGSGSDPANIFDTGYPLYALNICGDTPIIITPESVVCGGYMCPFVIPLGAQWKIGQCRVGKKLRFKYTTMEEAGHLLESYDAYRREDHYI